MQQLLSQKKLLFAFFLFVLFDIILAIFYFKPAILQKLLSFFKPQPGSCLILEEKYCSRAQKIEYNDRVIAVGFTLPEGTVIFSPFDGIFENSGSMFVKKEGKGYPIINVMTDFEGEYNWDAKRHFEAAFYRQDVKEEEGEVRKGDALGRVLSDPIEYYSPYNLVVYFAAPNENRTISIDRDYTLGVFGL